MQSGSRDCSASQETVTTGPGVGDGSKHVSRDAEGACLAFTPSPMAPPSPLSPPLACDRIYPSRLPENKEISCVLGEQLRRRGQPWPLAELPVKAMGWGACPPRPAPAPPAPRPPAPPRPPAGPAPLCLGAEAGAAALNILPPPWACDSLAGAEVEAKRDSFSFFFRIGPCTDAAGEQEYVLAVRMEASRMQDTGRSWSSVSVCLCVRLHLRKMHGLCVRLFVCQWSASSSAVRLSGCQGQ